MCGISGFANFGSDAEAMAKAALKAISYRGKDHSKVLFLSSDNLAFGHNLHSVVDFVIQPLETKESVLVINCEIYNWKELSLKHKITAKNDAELVQKLLDSVHFKSFHSIIEKLDGDFAFAYYSKKEKKLFIAKDIAGVKPLVYFFDDENGRFAFASEKKALNAAGLNAVHLNPRSNLIFDMKTKSLSFIERKIKHEKSSVRLVKKALISSVEKRIPFVKYGVLFSGGIDSVLLTKILSDKKQKPEIIFSSISGAGVNTEPGDLLFATNAAKFLGLKLHHAKTTLDEFETELPKIITLIESTDPIRVGVASTIYFASKKASSLGLRVVFSGLGADELFAGYYRFKNSNNINKDCYSYFIKMYENDLYFEDIVTMANTVELRVPFLDRKLVFSALSLPANQKFSEKKGKIINKKVLRTIASELDLPLEIIYREKKAAQYGSNFDKAIEVLAKKHGFKSKADYLNSISPITKNQSNIPVAALLSTGKDSVYAIHLMQKQGYDVRCLIALNPDNKDSFMYHTPTIELAKLQAKSLCKKLLLVHTKGEKEKEVEDLEKAVMLAKKMFQIEGVCSGALFSNYQRERIESACEKHSIRHFAPLWHLNQEQYLRKLIKSGFCVIVTKIASFGLNSNWLGRTLNSKAIDELTQLNKKFGVNVAGEGGEYETLVLDAPLFKKKIAVEFSKKMQNEFTGEIIIKKAVLVQK